MAQSLARVLIHLVFSTKGRRPLLPQTRFADLHGYAHGIFEKQKCRLIEMNYVSDHVHALFVLHRTEALSDVVMHVKKGTSRWLKEQAPEFAHFDWQEGYAPSRSAARSATKLSLTFETSSGDIGAFRTRMSFGSSSNVMKSNSTNDTSGIKGACMRVFGS